MTKKEEIFTWRSALRLGIIGGGVLLLAALVGLVETFNQRDIISGVISMGMTIVLLILLAIGAYTARRTGASRRVWALSFSALVGLIAALVLALFVLLGQQEGVKLREVLVNASPALYRILTFERTGLSGYLLLLAAGALSSLLGGLLALLPTTFRGYVTSALMWVGILGLLQEQLRIITRQWPAIDRSLTWMFGRAGQKGLSMLGAIVVFLLVVGISYALGRRRRAIASAPPPANARRQWLTFAAVAILLLILPRILGPVLSEVAATVGIFALMGLGLNIVVGFAGLLDLGYVAFFAIGAYVVGVLTTTGGELAFNFGWSFWAALPVAVGTAVVAGVLLGVPVLHIRGDYLAIVTLGFGEIIRVLALSDMLKPYIGGSQGIVQLAKAGIGNVILDKPEKLYYLIIVACLLAAFIAIRLKDSRLGRTWMAMREDEDVAEAMGIELVTTKLLAFGTGAAFSGLAGAIFASKLGTIYPHSFDLLISINALAIVIVGGMGSIPGVIVGTLALVGLPELLREFGEFRLLIFGAVLVAMMLLRPEGLLPEEARRRELQQAEAVAGD